MQLSFEACAICFTSFTHQKIGFFPLNLVQNFRPPFPCCKHVTLEGGSGQGSQDPQQNIEYGSCPGGDVFMESLKYSQEPTEC